MTTSGWVFLLLRSGHRETRGLATLGFISYDFEFFTDYFFISIHILQLLSLNNNNLKKTIHFHNKISKIINSQ
jgi:hypothetical protein